MLASQVLIRMMFLRLSIPEWKEKEKTHIHTTHQTPPAAALQRKDRWKEESLILYSTLRFLDAIVQLLDVTSGSNILTHTSQLYLPLLASTLNPSWKCQQNSKRPVSTWKEVGTRVVTLIRTEETFGEPIPKINLPLQSNPHVLHSSHQYETLNLIWLGFLATMISFSCFQLARKWGATGVAIVWDRVKAAEAPAYTWVLTE